MAGSDRAYAAAFEKAGIFRADSAEEMFDWAQALAAFDDVEKAGQAVADVIGAGIVPAGLEMMDNPAIRAAEDFAHAGYPTDVAAILLCELDGGEAEVAAEEKFGALEDAFKEKRWPECLALGDELFATGSEVHESDLSIAYQIAAILRRWRDTNPDWRLPELAAELEGVATGRRSLPITTPADLGYEPEPGRITLTTQHSAKGLEWDAVFLVGVDGFWIPGSLDAPFLGVHEFLGGDPEAEAVAQLRYLMQGESGLYNGRSVPGSLKSSSK